MKDYKDTLFLPNTKFSMQSGLVNLEKKIIQFWKDIAINDIIKKNRNKIYETHFGPTYSNAFPHIGTIFNALLKDTINRSYLLHGYQVRNMIGYDCHGLPIELAMLKQKKDLDKTERSLKEFRKDCRNFAQHFISIQNQISTNMGILTEDQYYTTMDSVQEIYSAFSRFLLNGYVYLDRKPLAWSTSEQCVIADVDITYQNKATETIDVALQITNIKDNELKLPNDTCAYICIWTTTPWTLVDNVAVAYNPNITYVFCETEANNILILAENLMESFTERTGIQLNPLGKIPGAALGAIYCQHPIYDRVVPLIESDHVNEDDGTGFVHMAPAHGVEDFVCCNQHDIELIESVDGKGFYYPSVELLGNKSIHNNEAILEVLEGKILAITTIDHQYPFSTRTNTPIIYRASDQIFIDLEKLNIKHLVNELKEKVNTKPKSLLNSFAEVLQKRKEWCISRQRAWGVPLALFVNKMTKELLINEELQKVILEKMLIDPEFFLSDNCISILDGFVEPEEYEPYIGVLEVWFDSGCVSNILSKYYSNHNECRVADVYIEGKDQVRGWFQSSLLFAYLFSQTIPYKNIISHGFVVDEHGYKMSKSKGNVVDGLKLLEENGGEILRLWVVNSDYTDDVSISNNRLEKLKEMYRKIRNVFRYLISIVESTDLQELSTEELSIGKNMHFDYLEQAMLMELKQTVINYSEYLMGDDLMNIKKAFDEVYLFILRLSGIYFNARKDTLYCDAANSTSKKSTIVFMYKALKCLSILLSNILPITMEEIYQYMKDINGELFNKQSVLEYSLENILQELDYNFNASIQTNDYNKILDEARETIEQHKKSGLISRNSDIYLHLRSNSNIDLDTIRLLLEVIDVKIDNNQQEDLLIVISDLEVCERCRRKYGNLCARCYQVINHA